MLEPDAERHIAAVFSRLAHAADTGDVVVFRALAEGPDPFQEALFLRNSLKLRENNHHLQLAAIERDDDLASVHFNVVDNHGIIHERGTIKLVQESSGWLVHEL